jgi:hypothetical protein
MPRTTGRRLAVFAALSACLCLRMLPASAETPAARCGNGLIEQGESCEACAADCKVEACEAGSGASTFRVELAAPPGSQPSAVTLLLAYRSSVLGIPGKGSDPEVRQRIESDASPAVLIPNDLGHALRVVVAKGGGFGSTTVVRVRFDRCAGAREPALGDLACVVEGCSGAAGAIHGCTCAVGAAP